MIKLLSCIIGGLLLIIFIILLDREKLIDKIWNFFEVNGVRDERGYLNVNFQLKDKDKFFNKLNHLKEILPDSFLRNDDLLK